MKKLKKALLTLGACALTVGAGVFTAAPACADEFIGVEVNGTPLFLEQQPVMREGRVLVPLRDIFQALGADVKWISETKTVHAEFGIGTDDEVVLELTIGSKVRKVNGLDQPLDVPAAIIDGYTMVPLRTVSEAMKSKVAWDGVDRQVRVVRGDDNMSALEPNIPEGAQEADWDLNSLKRIQTGVQAGLLRVLSVDGHSVLYSRTLDNFTNAPITSEQIAQVLAALDIQPECARSVARKLINSYEAKRKDRIQLVALLAILGNVDSKYVDLATKLKIETFLINKLLMGDKTLSKEEQAKLKRQCLLSLSLLKTTHEDIYEGITRFYEQNGDNNWTIAPITLYFQQHGEDFKTSPNLEELKTRINAVETTQSANISQYL